VSLPAATPDGTVLVTGASAGIGAELSRELARRGHGLTLVARRRERLEELAAELRGEHDTEVVVETCDLADPADRTRLIAALRASDRRVLGVCNNAGYGSVGSFAELPLEREVGEVRLNVEALVELTGAFMEDMIEAGEGAILNVASTASFQPLPGMATYAATKAFVRSFSEAVHAELSGTGVSVTVLCPGFTETEFAEVAGAGSFEAKMPGFLVLDAKDVARQAIEGMASGARTVVPGVIHKAHAFSSRFVPNTLLLPIARRLTEDRLAD
jgi:short-subunit dehydrogenase